MNKLIIPILFFCLPVTGLPQSPRPNPSHSHHLLVGTYTRGKSVGIYVYNFNSATGKSTLLSSTAASNPSYLAVSPNQRYVYAVNENKDSGAVTAYAFDTKTATLRKLNTTPSMGDDPCYVSIDKTGKWAFVANYSSGSFSVFPINADGLLGSYSNNIK